MKNWKSLTVWPDSINGIYIFDFYIFLKEEDVTRRLLFVMLIFCAAIMWSDISVSAAKKEKIPLTLEGAVETAMRHNRDILIAKEAKNRADQQIREARAGAWPSLDYSAGYTRTLKKPIMFFEMDGEVVKFSPGFMNSLTQTIAINQTLYAGGKTWTAIKIANIYARSFDEGLKQTEKNVRLQVREAFLGLLLSREMHEINLRSLENADAHLENVKALFRNGMSSEFDRLRAEVQVANARPKVIQSENSIVLQKDLLKNLIGLSLDQEIEIRGELLADIFDESAISEASRGAFQNRNDYKNLSLIRDAYNQNVKIERAGWFPNLSAQYIWQYQGQSDDWKYANAYRTQNVSLNFSIPIFDGFKTSARMQQARINVKETDYQLIKLKEGIEIQITQSRHLMEDALKRYESTEQTVSQAEKAYSIALVRFKSGQGTQLEIFDAQMAMELAQLNRLQSIYDYELARAKWENAVGQ